MEVDYSVDNKYLNLINSRITSIQETLLKQFRVKLYSNLGLAEAYFDIELVVCKFEVSSPVFIV